MIGNFMSKIYTGIGSRKTPIEILDLMKSIAYFMSKKDFILRSGGANGADSAFEETAHKKEIFLPTNRFNNKIADEVSYFDYRKCAGKSIADQMVHDYHPNSKKLTNFAFNLMARNAMQIFGKNMDSPTDMVICWTMNGEDIGGTSQAIRIARSFKIPVYNLGLSVIHDNFVQWVIEQTK